MAQLVEHNLAKVGVAGSSPVVRSIWAFSSGGERFPDTEEVRSSNLLTPTKCSQSRGFASGLFCYKHIVCHQIIDIGRFFTLHLLPSTICRHWLLGLVGDDYFDHNRARRPRFHG